MKRQIRIEIFDSFEDENFAERRRQAIMSPEERCRELAALQLRHWGKSWLEKPMVRRATWEELSWL